MSLNLDMLAQPAPEGATFTWATVTATGPLRIKLDGEASALPFTPTTLVAGLAVANRVLVLQMANADAARRSRRVVILGKAQ